MGNSTAAVFTPSNQAHRPQFTWCAPARATRRAGRLLIVLAAAPASPTMATSTSGRSWPSRPASEPAGTIHATPAATTATPTVVPTGTDRHGNQRVTAINTRSATRATAHAGTPSAAPRVNPTRTPPTTTPPTRRLRPSGSGPAGQARVVGWRRRYTSQPTAEAARLGRARWPMTWPTPRWSCSAAMRVVRLDTGSTDDARLASSSGTSASATGSTDARRASRR